MTASRAALLVALSSAGVALAQPPGPVGGDFQVNSYTTSEQFQPALAHAPDGSFLVTWCSYGSPGDDDDRTSLLGRHFGSDGSPAGGDFQVNTITLFDQCPSAVAAGLDQGFLVVWESAASIGDDTSQLSIQGRLFDGDGMPLNDGFQVNGHTTFDQKNPSIARLSTGDFLVVWQSDTSPGDDSDPSSVIGRRLGPDGSPLEDDFQVNSYTTGGQGDAVAVPREGGEFLVVWRSTPDGSVRGQLFDPFAVPVGDEFQINTSSGSNRQPSAVRVPSGETLVIWQHAMPAAEPDILGRWLDAAGAPTGSDFPVNTVVDGSQSRPWLDAGPAGDLVAVWKSGSDVAGRRFSVTGPLSDDFQVNAYTTGAQSFPRVSFGSGGRLRVVWSSTGSGGDDTDATSIQARVFELDVVFADGFESGDTSAWSVVVP